MKEINVLEISKEHRNTIKEKINELQIKPKLCVLQVGHDPSSDIYIRNKKRACEDVGIKVEHICYDENISTNSLLQDISALNTLNDVNGILVQLPLPKHIDEQAILASINPLKDVDGFSPIQTAKLYNNDINDRIEPCTAKGILDILQNITTLQGKNIVVVGRSHIVGKPVAHLLLEKNATVTICHSKTINLKSLTNQADIIVLATGQPNYFDSSYFDANNNQKIIIDAGISKVNNKVVGDLNANDLKEKINDMNILYTPVPKGVGVMTVTEVLKNMLQATLIIERRKENVDII